MTDRKLRALTEEIKKLAEELGVSNEQLAFLGEVADDARVRMLVEESPMAKRGYDEAASDLERHRKNHVQLQGKLQHLRKRQDEMLEKFYGG